MSEKIKNMHIRARLKNLLKNTLWFIPTFIVEFFFIEFVLILIFTGFLPYINLVLYYSPSDVDLMTAYAPMIALDVLIVYTVYKISYRLCKWFWFKMKNKFYKKFDVGSIDVKGEKQSYGLNEKTSVCQ